MPARYLTHPDGSGILNVSRQSRVTKPSQLLLNEAYLSSFGSLRLPQHLYTALQRFDVWIEPALIAEWIRLIKGYAMRQHRNLDDHALAQALQWSDPTREVKLARDSALKFIEQGDLHCVYSNKRLTASSLDIDHCLPWHAWPCSDLWNLLPTDRHINQAQKRERLPSEAILAQSKDRIQEWWAQAYMGEMSQQFRLEAHASLPLVGKDAALESVYAGVQVQRMRLRFDQGVSEWK